MSSRILLLSKCSAVPRLRAIHVADGVDKSMDIFADLVGTSAPYTHQVVAPLVRPGPEGLTDPFGPFYVSADLGILVAV